MKQTCDDVRQRHYCYCVLSSYLLEWNEKKQYLDEETQVRSVVRARHLVNRVQSIEESLKIIETFF